MAEVVAMNPDDDGERYESHKQSAAERQRRLSHAGRDIKPVPSVVDPARRERSRTSLLSFCRDYFPARFRLPFAECHFTAIREIEACVRDGGVVPIAMPRGSGKTAIAECAVLWAVLHGLHSFVVLLSATKPLASDSLRKIKRELERNRLLLADFPEVCYPIRKLDGNTKLASGQHIDGKRTEITWTAEEIVLPTVEGSAASGATLRVLGIEGAGRGLSISGPNGEIIRPGLTIADDCQTRDSAKSPTQTADREAIIANDIMGMVGPDQVMSIVIPCTVIYPNDLSDRFLSTARHPECQPVRVKLIEMLPDRMDLWDKYADIRNEARRAGDKKAAAATEFYATNRETMDAGAVVSWPSRVKKGDLSALQSAMNWRADNPTGFAAEGQNEPEPIGGISTAKELAPAEVVKRLSGLPRFEVPREASRVTAFIDPGGGRGRGLWYAVVAWDASYGGAVIDYGTWPRQASANFAADAMRPGLAELYPGLAEPARVYAGLTALAAQIMGRTYQREQGGGELRIVRLLVDAGWQSAAVYQWCRESPYAAAVYPSKGRARTTTSSGIGEWKSRPGEQGGYHWRLTISETGRGQMVQFDPDVWKTRVYESLTVPMGTPGRLVLYGSDSRVHEMIGEHLAAESSEPATVRGTTFDKWSEKPHHPDNHLLDCVVGCAVAASVSGLVFSASGLPLPAPTPPKPRKSLAEKQREKRGGLDADGRPQLSWR